MPSSPNYKRNYKQEAATETDARRKQRAARKRARRLLEKQHSKEAMQGMDVGHIKALSKGGSNSLRNLALQDPNQNQSFSRNPDGSMKSEKSKRERKR